MNNTLTINTDGGSRGNPGPAASAFVVKDNNKIVFSSSTFLGVTTNNVAEYKAIIEALNWLKNYKNNQLPISFFLDSELVVKQLTGIYKIKHQNMQNLAKEINDLLINIPAKITFTHVPRSQNKEADKLVNECLDKHVEKS